MEQIYRAIDGKIFETKEECEEYENQLDIIMLDYNLDRVINYDDFGYIHIGNDSSFKIVNNLLGYDYIMPSNIGDYYWDGMMRKWINLDDKITEIENKLQELKKVKEIFNNKGEMK